MVRTHPSGRMCHISVCCLHYGCSVTAGCYRANPEMLWREGPPSGPLLLGGDDTCPKHSLALLSGQADVIGNGNTEIKIENSYKCHSWRSEWLNPVLQTRWLLPCFVSHPTSQRAADPAVPCGALCAFRSLLGPLRRGKRFCSRSCFQCDSRRSCV